MEILTIDGAVYKRMLLVGAAFLEKNKAIIDSLNVFPVPDGDTGTNMSLTMSSAIKMVQNAKDLSLGTITELASKGSLMGARGNSGVILSQLMRGIHRSIGSNTTLDAKGFAQALKSASDTAYKAVMKPTEGTILTVARACAEKAQELCKTINDMNTLLVRVIEYGKIVLSKTPDMLPVLKEANVVDAGGQGLIYILEGFLKGMLDEEVIDFSFTTEQPASPSFVAQEHVSGDIEFGYCTEFIINVQKSIDESILKSRIESLGDSMLVVGDDDVVKVHIHTNNPGIVIEEALKLGYLSDIKIDNMRIQHENVLIYEQAQPSKPKKYGVIAVAMGEGISDIFRDLGVDKVIFGGQTMNPSTEDILKAVSEVNAENIFVLPNNSNIILAASQAKALSDRNLIVIPSKTVPQGVSAMLTFDTNASIEDLTASMEGALSEVKTGSVTYAVRTTSFNGKDICEGDIIGIAEGDICSVGNTIADVSLDLVNSIVTDDDEIITIFYGEDVTLDDAKNLADSIEEAHPDLDVEIHYGGQPLYYFIISLE